LTGFGERPMRHSLPARAHAAAALPPELCRAFGLAAVAAELGLKVDTLEPEIAEFVGRGATTLFLAGYGPKGSRRSRPSRQFGWDSDRPKARRAARYRRLAERPQEAGASISKTTVANG
jgi:hypothetical protein